MDIIYLSVRLSSRRGGVNRVDGGKGSHEFHFSRVRDNLVYDPCNNKSIIFADCTHFL